MATADTVLLACTCAITVLVCTIESIDLLCNARGYCSRSFEIAKQYFISISGPEDQQRNDAQSRLAVRLTEIRVESYLMLLNMAMHLGAGLSASWLLRLILGLPQAGDPVTMGMNCAAYLSALLVRLRPEKLTPSNIWILHCWNMGLLFSYGAYLAFAKPQWFVHYYPPILGFRTFLSIVYPVAQSNVYWNLAWIVVGVFGMSNANGTNDEIPISSVILNEFCIAAFLCYIVFKFDQLQTSQVHSDIQANWCLRAKKTMEKLLADMCDAVVELDPDLMIRTACPKLAGLLLRDPGASSLKHERFSNLVSTEQDRGRFADFVTERAVPVEEEQSFDGAGQGSSIYLNLRDATGTLVSVQLFHSCHYNPSDEICHVVGVREVDKDIHGCTRPGTPPSPANPSGEEVPPPLIVEPSPPRTARKKRATSQTAVSDDEQPRQGQIDRQDQSAKSSQEHARRTSDGEDSDASSAFSTRSDRSRKNMLEGFRPTSPQAMHSSILHLLGTWNVTLPRMGCCSYHALLKENAKAIKWLANRRCQHFHANYLHSPPWQCPTCGILGTSAEAMGFDPAKIVCLLCSCFESSTPAGEMETPSPTLIEI